MTTPDLKSAKRNDLDVYFCIVLVVSTIAGVGIAVYTGLSNERASSPHHAFSSFAQQELAAEELIREHTVRFPDDFSGTYLAAEAAAKAFRHERAVELYKKLPRDSSQWRVLTDHGLSRRPFVCGICETDVGWNNSRSASKHRHGHSGEASGRKNQPAGF